MNEYTHKIAIKQCKLEVCSACQNDCKYCAHGYMKKFYPDYHLELSQLQTFLESCLNSGYFIEYLTINGPGEPLLWKHLEAGLNMIETYINCIGTVNLFTNGILLPSLCEAIITSCSKIKIFLSGYEYNVGSESIKNFTDKYPDLITFLPKDKFVLLPAKREVYETPCECFCPGPMLFGDKMFLFCGPPVFGAAFNLNIDIISRFELYTEVKQGWFDEYLERGLHLDNKNNYRPVVSMDLCSCCWGNSYNHLSEDRKVIHSLNGGNWC